VHRLCFVRRGAGRSIEPQLNGIQQAQHTSRPHQKEHQPPADYPPFPPLDKRNIFAESWTWHWPGCRWLWLPINQFLPTRSAIFAIEFAFSSGPPKFAWSTTTGNPPRLNDVDTVLPLTWYHFVWLAWSNPSGYLITPSAKIISTIHARNKCWVEKSLRHGLSSAASHVVQAH
jgi:hypothetical protein